MQIKVSSRTDNLNKNFEKLIALKQQIKDREAKGEKFIDFSIGDPKEDIDTLAIKTIKENIEKRAGVGYPNFAGEPEYRKACCEYMKKFHNTDLNWETEVCGTNGVKDAIAHFLLSFIDKGDLVIEDAVKLQKAGAKNLKAANDTIIEVTAANNAYYSGDDTDKEIFGNYTIEGLYSAMLQNKQLGS